MTVTIDRRHSCQSLLSSKLRNKFNPMRFLATGLRPEFALSSSEATPNSPPLFTDPITTAIFMVKPTLAPCAVTNDHPAVPICSPRSASRTSRRKPLQFERLDLGFDFVLTALSCFCVLPDNVSLPLSSALCASQCPSSCFRPSQS